MMEKLLINQDQHVNGETFYLADYPEHSIQEWADMIRIQVGHSGKTPVFPIRLMFLLGILGDLLKKLGWSDPPLTTFRLNNMLTGAHYPIEKTESILGELPFKMEEGIFITLNWMREEGLIKVN